MDIKITGKAEAELLKIESKTFRIAYDNDCGWISMAYSLVQDGPKPDDIVVQQGDRTFIVQSGIAKDVDYFEVDYHNGWLRKVFTVFPNGENY